MADAANDAALARELGLDEVAYPETKILLKLHQHDDANAADDLRALQRSLRRSEAWVGPTLEAYRHPERRPAAIALLDRPAPATDRKSRVIEIRPLCHEIHEPESLRGGRTGRRRHGNGRGRDGG